MKTRSSRFFEVFIGLVLSAFVLWSYYLCNFIFKDPAYFYGPEIFSLLESIELKLYDARSKFLTSIDAGSREIVIVAIDDDSLARLGRWPWPRSRIAQMVDLLASAKPKVLGVDIIYSEPEEVEGSQEIEALSAKYKALLKSRRILQRGDNFASEFDSALTRLDFDSTLEHSFSKAGNVVLPMMFTGGGLRGAKPEPMPSAIASSALSVRSSGPGNDLGHTNMEGTKPVVPLPRFAQAVQGVGHVNIYPDFDGVVRREYPIVKYGEKYYPSFALQLVIQYLGFGPKDVTVTLGKSIQLGKNAIPVDDNQSMLVSFSGANQTFHNYSFYDVLNGKVAMDVFKDKIVIMGPAASAISTLYVTPVSHNLPSTELWANIIENMLHLRFLGRPAWAVQAELGSIGVAAFFVTLMLPFLSAFWGAFLAILLLAGLGGAGVYYFIHGIWLKIAYSGSLLAIGYVIMTTRRFFAAEKGKERVEASNIETNKMLGLSFQGQGMLDLAFEKFRLCPLDEPLKELLYNLGLDFERKRQFNKAVAVYEYIATEYPKYKDIPKKIKVLKEASEGAVFGGIGGKTKEGTVLVTDGASKPTLGRYEVEKEIGRGAMGRVYLGNDPKINRKVAIKTMVLEEGLEPNEVKETKERFFREAESAGTLNHPNIVRIFDAGDEHDISYIAMELLDGHDLTQYTSGTLLAPDVAMEYLAKVADALDYAHAQGIIHRDVKPANIMLLKDSSIRVMDFGIARIMASSKTATGTVVGTPAYMSPEQVSGKKVDGRSDIFSLGIVLFELLTGIKPFRATDGGLGSLLFQITNEPEPDPQLLNSHIPFCAKQIVHRAMKKDPNQRYQKAADMAAALRACVQGVDEGGKEANVVLPEPPPPPSDPVPVTADLDRTISLSPTLTSIEGAASPPVSSTRFNEEATLSLTSLRDMPASPTGSESPQPDIAKTDPTMEMPPPPGPITLEAPNAPSPAPDLEMRSAEEIAASITGMVNAENALGDAPARNEPSEHSTLDLRGVGGGPPPPPTPTEPSSGAPAAEPPPPPSEPGFDPERTMKLHKPE